MRFFCHSAARRHLADDPREIPLSPALLEGITADSAPIAFTRVAGGNVIEVQSHNGYRN